MKKIFLVLLAVVSTASSSFAKNNEQLGAVTGAVVGAAAGHELGGATGAMVGAFAGTVIGSKIGQNMDAASRQAWHNSCDEALEYGGRSDWRTDRYYGHTHVVQRGYYQQRECRAYDSMICSNYGGCQTYRQVSCYTTGRWYEISEREYNYVRWY